MGSAGSPDPSSPSPFDKLPNELLSTILLHVKINSSASCFLSCLLCCKAWHSIALPLLYHDVLLVNLNLKAFARQFNLPYGSFVRSLTICIDPIIQKTQPDPYDFFDDDTYMRVNGTPELNRLWASLRDTVASMTRLRTFSFQISPQSSYDIEFWVPKPILALIIEALPDTCVNLEIDTCGLDFHNPGSAHVCEAIRGTLPHLRSLRVRLNTLCPAVFGTGFDPTNPAKFFSNFQPVASSSLHTVVINCIAVLGRGGPSKICGTSPEVMYSYDSGGRGQSPQVVLVDSLCLGVERRCYPVAKRLWVVNFLAPIRRAWNDMWIYPTIFRRDILADEIFAIPLEYLSVFDGGFLVRTLEGKEIISYLWAIEAIIEGQTWRETTDGYRLPDTVLETESTIYAAEMLPLQSTEDWKAKHPGETCTLWEHENVCKRRLLDAEKRKGLTNVALITEKTPVGWHRIYDGYDLVQDES